MELRGEDVPAPGEGGQSVGEGGIAGAELRAETVVRGDDEEVEGCC